MPTNVEGSALNRARTGYGRALRSIKQVDGYNTNPLFRWGAVPVSKIPDNEFPTIAVEMGDLSIYTETEGAQTTNIIRYSWPAMTWGYVKSTESKDALYRAGEALLLDIVGAIYSNETLPDANGQGSVLMVNPGDITFDMESLAGIQTGYFLARFDLILNLRRSGSP